MCHTVKVVGSPEQKFYYFFLNFWI